MPTVAGSGVDSAAIVPRIGILALQGDVHAHSAALAACGARVERVRRPEELDLVDGIVIPGGESTTIGALAETYGVFEPLRKSIAAGMPAFGSCAGAILLAGEIVDGRPDQRCLQGIDMTVRRNGYGRQVDSFEADLEIEGITDIPSRSGPLRAIFIRAPWIEHVGTDVRVLARYGGRIVAARHGDVLATAFHPEISGDHRVHQYFVDIVASHIA
jgi:5'-phosphate synthase pdxT subunit